MGTPPMPSQRPPEFIDREFFPTDDGKKDPKTREPRVEGGEEALIAEIEGYTDAQMKERLALLFEVFDKIPENTQRIILNELARVKNDIENPQRSIEERVAIATKWIGKLASYMANK